MNDEWWLEVCLLPTEYIIQDRYSDSSPARNMAQWLYRAIGIRYTPCTVLPLGNQLQPALIMLYCVVLPNVIRCFSCLCVSVYILWSGWARACMQHMNMFTCLHVCVSVCISPCGHSYSQGVQAFVCIFVFRHALWVPVSIADVCVAVPKHVQLCWCVCLSVSVCVCAPSM